MDAWLDAFLTLDRFSIDVVQICTRSFRCLTDKRMTDVCLRRLDNVHVYFHHISERVLEYSATLCSRARRIDIKEPDMEEFIARLKAALFPSTISDLVVNAESNANIRASAYIFRDIWMRVQVQSLSVGLSIKDDPQECYAFIFTASPHSCSFDFASVKDEAASAYSYGQRRALSQFFTDQRLRECVAHKITDLDFEGAVPADAERFPLCDDGIVDFLFGSPELKRKRRLTIGHTSASRNIFKRIVQAHLESDITEDISLELGIHSFDPQEEMDTTEFGENRLDYGYGVWADLRIDSSVQYEFPGDIRLQIVLLDDKLQLRRGRRRGWRWTSREERERWLEENDTFDNGDFYDGYGAGDRDDGSFFIGHSAYAEYLAYP